MIEPEVQTEPANGPDVNDANEEILANFNKDGLDSHEDDVPLTQFVEDRACPVDKQFQKFRNIVAKQSDQVSVLDFINLWKCPVFARLPQLT